MTSHDQPRVGLIQLVACYSCAMARLQTLCALVTLFACSHAAECHGKPDPNAQPNLLPIQTAPPTLLNTSKNGKLYQVGDGEDRITLLHVWGTPYEMGYAHGELLAEKTNSMMDDVWSYLQEQVVEAMNGTVSYFPQWFLTDVANVGLESALDLEYDVTRKLTGDYFEQEIKGLADASGCNEKKIRRIHMVGELTKGQCSMFGANATATPDGHLLQLRALDWDVDGPFKNYPQITVYHPNSDNGYAFANIGWTGWIGSITGISSQKISISEIGVSFPDETFGKESRFGIPFTYLLRDILQFDDSLQGAMKRISDAKRTCNLILGVGDGKINEFRGVEYSASVADFFTYENLRPVEEWHPQIQDIVYWGMDWLCPGYSQALGKALGTLHGSITARATISHVVPIVQTGDLHVAIYDHHNDTLYVANARGEGETGAPMAYDRAFVQLDMSEVFAVKRP